MGLGVRSLREIGDNVSTNAAALAAQDGGTGLIFTSWFLWCASNLLAFARPGDVKGRNPQPSRRCGAKFSAEFWGDCKRGLPSPSFQSLMSGRGA